MHLAPAEGSARAVAEADRRPAVSARGPVQDPDRLDHRHQRQDHDGQDDRARAPPGRAAHRHVVHRRRLHRRPVRAGGGRVRPEVGRDGARRHHASRPRSWRPPAAGSSGAASAMTRPTSPSSPTSRRPSRRRRHRRPRRADRASRRWSPRSSRRAEASCSTPATRPPPAIAERPAVRSQRPVIRYFSATPGSAVLERHKRAGGICYEVCDGQLIETGRRAAAGDHERCRAARLVRRPGQARGGERARRHRRLPARSASR